jgi:hypothetical protein
VTTAKELSVVNLDHFLRGITHQLYDGADTLAEGAGYPWDTHDQGHVGGLVPESALLPPEKRRRRKRGRRRARGETK